MKARQQRGALLLLILPLLPVMALAVSASLRTSDTQTRIIHHQQQRQQAESAAWLALHEQMASDWPGQPARLLALDLDSDGQPDHRVSLAAPLCLRADPYPDSADALIIGDDAVDASDARSATPDRDPPVPAGTYWLTLWRLQASAHDPHQQALGEAQLIVRRRLPGDARQRLCPLPGDAAPAATWQATDTPTSALDSAPP